MAKFIVADNFERLKVGHSYLIYDDVDYTLIWTEYTLGMEIENVFFTSVFSNGSTPKSASDMLITTVTSRLGFAIDKLNWKTLYGIDINFNKNKFEVIYDGYCTDFEFREDSYFSLNGGDAEVILGYQVKSEYGYDDKSLNSGRCYLRGISSSKYLLEVKPFGYSDVCDVYALLCTYKRNNMAVPASFVIYLHKDRLIGCLSCVTSAVKFCRIPVLLEEGSSIARCLLMTGVDIRGFHKSKE